MPPWAHVAHYRHPAQALKEKFAQGSKISDRLHGVRQELHFKTLFSNKTPDKQIIRRAPFNRGVAAESREMLSGGHNGLSERKLHTVQLPRHQNARIEVANHTDRLKLLEQRVLLRGHIQTRDGT